jgi:N-acetyl-beta-hexosaminidase
MYAVTLCLEFVKRLIDLIALQAYLGVQGNVWTEYMLTPAYVEYMVWPRALAVAETGWTPADQKDFSDFSKRLEVHKKRLDYLGVNYFGAPVNDNSNMSGLRKSKV